MASGAPGVLPNRGCAPLREAATTDARFLDPCDRVHHVQGLARRCDVVHPVHPGTQPGADGGGCEGAGKAFGGNGNVQGLGDKVLAGQRDKDRPPGSNHLAESARHLEGLPRVLPEVMSWVDEDALGCDPGGGCSVGQAKGAFDHVGDNIRVGHPMWAGARLLPTSMGAHDARVELRRHVHQIWIHPTPRVVDQEGTGLARCLGDLCAPGVHADDDGRVALMYGGDEGGGTPNLLGRIDVRTRACLDPADIENVRSRCHGRIGRSEGGFIVEGCPGVVEGIRGAIDDRHHEALISRPGALTEANDASSGSVPGTGHRHGTMMPMVVLFVLLGIGVITAIALLASGRWPDPGLADDQGDRGVPDLVDVPVGELTVQDVESLRMDPAVRGYRMEEVDAVVDRLAAEIAERDEVIRRLRGEGPNAAPVAQPDEAPRSAMGDTGPLPVQPEHVAPTKGTT
jgi:DivIVA domain-containing protein